MGRVIEKHQITIQVATVIVVLLSIIAFTRSFTQQETRINTSIEALQKDVVKVKAEMATERLKSIRTEVELAKITTELQSIKAILAQFLDSWTTRTHEGNGT